MITEFILAALLAIMVFMLYLDYRRGVFIMNTTDVELAEVYKLLAELQQVQQDLKDGKLR